MIIKTKYDLGQKVFIIHFDQICEGVIEYIETRESRESKYNYLYYRVIYILSENKIITGQTDFKEKDIFPNKGIALLERQLRRENKTLGNK